MRLTKVPKVNNAHDRAVRDSKVSPFRLYDLRRTWATRAAEAGIDLVALAAMLDHNRIKNLYASVRSRPAPP